MTLLKHYWIDRSNLNVFALSQSQYNTPLFGTVAPSIAGLEIVHRVNDENDIPFCLSTCPDESQVTETEGLWILTQEQWDEEIASYDFKQETTRFNIVRQYRDKALQETDWLVIKAKETETELSADFKTWRQELRDLPQSESFPVSFPTAPEEVSLSFTEEEYHGALRNVPMINDPVPSPSQDELGIE